MKKRKTKLFYAIDTPEPIGWYLFTNKKYAKDICKVVDGRLMELKEVIKRRKNGNN